MVRNLSLLVAVGLGCAQVASADSLDDLLVAKGVITKGATSANAPSGVAVSYKKGVRFDAADGSVSAKINTQIQTRYTYTDNDSGDNTSSFSVRRARITMSGSAMNKEFDYKLQTDFVGTSSDGTRVPDLRDAYIDWHATGDTTIRMGQFKALVSRQEQNSSSELQFPDRTIASEYFAISRVPGARVTFAPADAGYMVAAGILNGESDGEGRNKPGVDTDHTGEVGFRANLLGEMEALSEGDVGRTQETAVNVGGNYTFTKAQVAAGDLSDDVDVDRVNVDANLKSNGFSLHGEFFWGQYDFASADEKSKPIGWYAQAGYMLSENFEVVGRYSSVDCDDGAAPGDCEGLDALNQASAGVNYYWWNHQVKAQLAYEHQQEEPVAGEDVEADKIILQMNVNL